MHGHISALVGSDAGPGGPVVGDDQGVVLRGEVGDAVGDERRQRRGIAHVGRAEIGELHGRVAGQDLQHLGADPVADVERWIAAVLGGPVDQGDDVEVGIGADGAHLVDVGHHERLEVVVGHRVVQHGPAGGRGGLARREDLRRGRRSAHRTRRRGRQRDRGDDGRRDHRPARTAALACVHRSSSRASVRRFVRRSIEPVNGLGHRSPRGHRRPAGTQHLT